MSILYEVKCYADYKENLKKTVFTNLADAQKYMREKWQEAINTNDYDFDEVDSYIRQSENVVTERSYYEDDYARVTWKMWKLEEVLQFNIEEVDNCLVPSAVRDEVSTELAKVLCGMSSDIDASLKYAAEDVELVAKQIQLMKDIGADSLVKVLESLLWVMTKGTGF